MTLAEQIEDYTPPADIGCLAAVPAAANDNSWTRPVGWREPPRGWVDMGLRTCEAGPAPGVRPPLKFDHLPRVIALSGAAGSGKSTVSDFLAVRFGYQKTKFAFPLKEMCRAIGMTEAMIEGDKKEDPVDWLGGKTPRYMMQRLGTEFGRDCMGEDFWVDLWEESTKRLSRVVVDDARFPNEAARVRQMGGRVIRLVGRGGIAGGHVSEQVNFIADAVIENTGTIVELQARVLEVIEGWRDAG